MKRFLQGLWYSLWLSAVILVVAATHDPGLKPAIAQDSQARFAPLVEPWWLDAPVFPIPETFSAAVTEKPTTILLPDNSSDLITAYAPAGEFVRLVIPIRYNRDRAAGREFTGYSFDHMIGLDEKIGGSPTFDFQANWEHDGRVMVLQFVMPKVVSSLNVRYSAPFKTALGWSNRGSRIVDIHLVPERDTHDEWLMQLEHEYT